MPIRVLALDLERTLIDDARSARPRPGLAAFLAFCEARFGRVALFTTVEEPDAREVVAELGGRGCLPPGFADRLEYVAWTGQYKDLAFVPDATPDEVLLVDDDAAWVRPNQREQWVPVAPWDGGADAELPRVRAELEAWLAGTRNPSVEKGEPGA